ncbi:MAG: DUF4406 domain-containing protein [Victivallaceae bacterium]|jgi:hypothetical protein
MTKKTVYIAGPMTGIEKLNFPAFFDAERALKLAGHNPVNPARHPPAVRCIFTEEVHTMTYEDFLNLDLEIIASGCDAVALLPGWEHSPGARREHQLAVSLGLKVWKLNAVQAGLIECGQIGRVGRGEE